MEYVTLNNGIICPAAGIGTFMLAPSDAERSVREALKMGYSLVDTANAYVNERAVGRGISDSGINREKVFLSTKLWPMIMYTFFEDNASGLAGKTLIPFFHTRRIRTIRI